MVTKCEVINWEQFENDIHLLAENIRCGRIEFQTILGIPRGGLVVGVRLSHMLKVPLVLEVLNNTNEKVLLVDDVNDSSATIKQYIRQFKQTPWTAALYRKDVCKIETNFVARTINTWICFPWEAE